MTVIAAWVTAESVILGADSALLGGFGTQQNRVSQGEKIRPVALTIEAFNRFEEAYVAAYGNSSAGPLAWYGEPPDPPLPRAGPASLDDEIKLDRWAYRWACQLDTEARAAGIVAEADGVLYVEAAWLIAYRGRAWVANGRSARPIGRFAAVGSGGSYALGALDALANAVQTSRITAAEAVEQAILTACSYDAACRPPVQLVVCGR